MGCGCKKQKTPETIKPPAVKITENKTPGKPLTPEQLELIKRLAELKNK